MCLAALSGAGCSSAQEREGLDRKGVTSGSCTAVIWMPPFNEPKSQAMTETIMRSVFKLPSVHSALTGEASDTGEAYICFESVAGEEAVAVAEIRNVVSTDLPNSGLMVLGPFKPIP